MIPIFNSLWGHPHVAQNLSKKATFYSLLWKENVYEKKFMFVFIKVSLGRRNILKVTVKNSGRRAAFVKAVCYAGMVEFHF